MWKKQTNYEICSYTEIIKNRHIFHVSMLAISSLFCLPAIIIFFMYPSLRITRFILHRNLLIAIFFKNIFVILSKTLITLKALNLETSHVLEENSVTCRMLAFFERILINAMYASMLIDGYYLHKVIVRVFDNKEPNMYILYTVIAGEFHSNTVIPHLQYLFT